MAKKTFSSVPFCIVGYPNPTKFLRCSPVILATKILSIWLIQN